MRFMIGVGIAGAALLFVFTAWLALRNWTPEVYRPVASILVGGVVALLITLLTILRTTEQEARFVSSVVLDERTRLPALVGAMAAPDPSAPLQARIAARHLAVGTLARREPVPVQPEERLDALTAEFFEYKLLLDLADSLGANPQQIHRLGPDEHGINRISVSIRQRMLPPTAVQVPGERVLAWLEANRLSHLPIEIAQWKSRGLWLPKGAEVRLHAETVDTIPHRVMTITVPATVTVTIQVEGRGSPGTGILPPALMVNAAELQHYSTYGIVVTMHARFHWFSAASPQMQAYKQWVPFVFDRLQQLNADNASW